jgi:hypothetical protein
MKHFPSSDHRQPPGEAIDLWRPLHRLAADSPMDATQQLAPHERAPLPVNYSELHLIKVLAPLDDDSVVEHPAAPSGI